jgi:hypothetical protein
MKNKSLQIKLLATFFVMCCLVAFGRLLLSHCSEHPAQLAIDSAKYIDSLYPWPDAHIPFTCHVFAFLKSPFAPVRMSEDVFKEEGIFILGGNRREGVIIANITLVGELGRLFPEPIKLGEIPPFAHQVSIYVDGKMLRIGHIGYREFDREFNFITILNPFLLPGDHVGKIVIQLYSGETVEYEWHFKITWW